MNNSKNTFSLFLFFENIKKNIEIFLKTCSRKNRVYADASTQTDVFCNPPTQDLMDFTKILSPQQGSEASLPSNKFVEDDQFNRIIKSYSQLNSSNCPPLNLNNGSLFQLIYAEGQSPSELDRPSTAVSHVITFSPPDPKLLPKKTRTIAL